MGIFWCSHPCEGAPCCSGRRSRGAFTSSGVDESRAVLYVCGALLQVLVEGPNPKATGQAMGRSRHNKLVFFDGDNAALTGELVTVFIERVHAYSLFGRRVA